MFQQNALFPWCRGIDNVMFPLRVAGVPRRLARARARDLLAAVRLDDRAAQAYPYELSGGMQQRVAIARALARDTTVLLLDEPFGALDDHTRRTLQQQFLDIWRERGMTVLFVTHSIEEALVMGCRVAVMSSRGIVEDRRVALPRPRDPLSDAFAAELLSMRRTFAAAMA